MPSINVDINFFSHRKTLRLAAQLGDQAITALIRLWCYVAKHDPDHGTLNDLLDYEIEHVCNWSGERGCFVRTLISLGFLDIENGKAKIHGWEDHSWHLSAYRAKAKKAAEARWNMRNLLKAKDVNGDAPSMPQAKSYEVKTITYAPSITPSNANTIQYNTIQEKKSSVSQVQKPSKPPLLTDNEWIEGLKTNPAYQHINLPVELGKIDAWLNLPANKNRKKTRRFVLNWLNRIEQPLTQVNSQQSYQGAYHKKVVL